jgi:hypothetical protein
MATTYDPEVLQTYADRLYRRAAWIRVWYIFLGLFGGVFLDVIILGLAGRQFPRENFNASGIVLLPLIGVLVGLAYGWGKMYQLRLDAQRTLCQLQIERNTRPPSSAMTGAASKPTS